MVSERDIEALREAMPDLLAARCGITDLRRSFKCPSPEHDDSDPSAHYYPDNCTVHCFGCNKTWDAFSLIGELDGIDAFPEQAEAVAMAVGYRLDDSPAARASLPRPRPKPRPKFDVPRAAGGADCWEAIGRAFGELYRPENDVGRRYLRHRGLDDDDAARFGLGFTRNPREIMPEFKVYEPEALGFITIPFFTSADCGAANYCMVRTISRGAVRNKEWRPAGIASPLWGEWMLSASLESVYIAEGLIDAMALTKLVGGNVMALGGVANAKRLAQVLYHTPAAKRPGKVLVFMDEDDEGRKARDRILADLRGMGVACNAAPPYPDGAKDADEWLMAMRDKEWKFEERSASPMDGPLYRTRWL